jgi:hypothetical protein
MCHPGRRGALKGQREGCDSRDARTAALGDSIFQKLHNRWWIWRVVYNGSDPTGAPNRGFVPAENATQGNVGEIHSWLR